MQGGSSPSNGENGWGWNHSGDNRLLRVKEDRDKSIAAGCDTQLAEPIDKARLLETIREFSGHRGP